MSNDTETLTLTDFLLARIAEDETVARAAIGTAVFTSQTGRWVAEDVHDQFGAIPLVFAVTDTGAKTQVANFEAAWERDERRTHIARHDPARVLAECEAKRRVVEEALLWGCQKTMARILAQAYADHPDFLEEWRP